MQKDNSKHNVQLNFSCFIYAIKINNASKQLV